MATRQDLVVEQGRTFRTVVRWEVEPLVFKQITSIAQVAPARITVAAHGMPSGWRAAVVDVKGMTELNATHNPPALSDFRRMTAVDANTLDVDETSAAGFKPYKSGGYIAYYTPADLTSYAARMTVRDKIGGTVLATLTSPSSIVVDNTAKAITLVLSATTTAAYTWTRGVYDLELESPVGVVTALLTGFVTLTKEVTT